MKTNKFMDWWNSKSYPLKFLYGLLAGLLAVLIVNFFIDGTSSNGLRIDKNYIKAVTPCQAEVNDVYLSKMIDFADECKGNQSFYRAVDLRGNLYGLALWCKHSHKAFTFYYSDKWRKENERKK